MKKKKVAKKAKVAMVPNTPKTITFKNGTKFIIKQDTRRPNFPIPHGVKLV